MPHKHYSKHFYGLLNKSDAQNLVDRITEQSSTQHANFLSQPDVSHSLSNFLGAGRWVHLFEEPACEALLQLSKHGSAELAILNDFHKQNYARVDKIHVERARLSIELLLAHWDDNLTVVAKRKM